MPEYGESVAAHRRLSRVTGTDLSDAVEEKRKRLQEISAAGIHADLLLSTPEWTWYVTEMQQVAENAAMIADGEMRKMAEGPMVAHEELLTSKLRIAASTERARTAREAIEFVKMVSNKGTQAREQLKDLTNG